MGFFSWITADTKESIPNVYSSRETFTVYMTAPDGRQWRESAYEGYGEFGGKDYYELVAELNGKTSRSEGISICFSEYVDGVVLPTLSRSKDWTVEDGLPSNCPNQGYFY